MGDIGKGIDILLWIALASIPLAIWKIVDIVVWIAWNVRITVG